LDTRFHRRDGELVVGEPDPVNCIVPSASSRQKQEQMERRRTSDETGSLHLPWGEEGVVLGAGAVFPLQPGGYGCGRRRHRSVWPAPVAGGWQSAQRRRCRTTGMVAGSGFVSCFENLGSLDWAGRGRRSQGWVMGSNLSRALSGCG
jgi:hypothetical protein